MGDPSYWYDFKEERISGWTYLFRVIVGIILTLLIVPGPFLISSTVYKRAGALGWFRNLRIFSSIMIPLSFLFNVYGWLLIEIVEPDLPFIFWFLGLMVTIVISLLNFTLIFTDSSLMVSSRTSPFNSSSYSASSKNFLVVAEDENERYTRLKKMIFDKFLLEDKSSSRDNEVGEDAPAEDIGIEEPGLLDYDSIEANELDDENKIIIKKSENRFEFKLSKGWSQ